MRNITLVKLQKEGVLQRGDMVSLDNGPDCIIERVLSTSEIDVRTWDNILLRVNGIHFGSDAKVGTRSSL
jgi:hypothetical protein